MLEHTTVITAGIQGRPSSRKGGEPGEPERLRPQEVAQSETYAPRPLLTDRRRTSATNLVGSAGGAQFRAAVADWFPPAATSNRACGSPVHGSPTSFTADIRPSPWGVAALAAR